MIESLKVKFEKLVIVSLQILTSYENENTILFGKVFQSFNGGVFQSKYYVSHSKYKLITIKNVDDNGFNTSPTSFLLKEKINSKYLLNFGEIILTMTGNIGRSGIVDEENCYLNQRVLKLTAKSKIYLYCYLIKYKKNIIQLGKGTAQLNLSLEDLNNLEVHNSPLEIIAFSKYDSIFDCMLNISLQLKKLKEIKTILLSIYF